ncbi:hypothetical protein HBA54_24040 [Pelagibius litoralis]|uniref:PH domain-containing protein n=1 Tax=Pelagibius litoralis TaxID=374515 RepID=A0A967KAJ1_9PROT|nr:hypothetical protein [Pelagibius litoralis]NIA71668.1 hypothetical protein [Pelagibius litoralis]
MIVLRYPPRALMGDYLRSGAGLLVGFGVLAAVPPNLPVLVIFGGIALLFSIFGIRTLRRHKLEVALTDNEIACRGFGTKVLPWAELEVMKLRYFGARKGKRGIFGSGFMELTLKGAGTAVTFESSLDGFEKLAAAALRSYKERGLEIDPATASNLIELGIDSGTTEPGCDSPPNIL